MATSKKSPLPSLMHYSMSLHAVGCLDFHCISDKVLVPLALLCCLDNISMGHRAGSAEVEESRVPPLTHFYRFLYCPPPTFSGFCIAPLPLFQVFVLPPSHFFRFLYCPLPLFRFLYCPPPTFSGFCIAPPPTFI